MSDRQILDKHVDLDKSCEPFFRNKPGYGHVI